MIFHRYVKWNENLAGPDDDYLDTTDTKNILEAFLEIKPYYESFENELKNLAYGIAQNIQYALNNHWGREIVSFKIDKDKVYIESRNTYHGGDSYFYDCSFPTSLLTCSPKEFEEYQRKIKDEKEIAEKNKKARIEAEQRLLKERDFERLKRELGK